MASRGEYDGGDTGQEDQRAGSIERQKEYRPKGGAQKAGGAVQVCETTW